jgi:hypothetical protein
MAIAMTISVLPFGYYSSEAARSSETSVAQWQNEWYCSTEDSSLAPECSMERCFSFLRLRLSEQWLKVIIDYTVSRHGRHSTSHYYIYWILINMSINLLPERIWTYRETGNMKILEEITECGPSYLVFFIRCYEDDQITECRMNGAYISNGRHQKCYKMWLENWRESTTFNI